jgi:ribosomal protein L44E
VGFGNQGRYSKKGVKDYKMKAKVTRRIGILYKCNECGKIKGIRKAIRSSRIEIGEKISK